MRLPAEWIVPDWPAPRRVRAFVTTRHGGVSEGAFASLNLGAHGGDRPDRVAENRRRVRAHLPAEPAWIAQVHGTAVADAARHDPSRPADAAIARAAGAVCAVLTADCLPVLLCDEGGREVAAAHAGWRGLSAGVLESALAALGGDPSRLVAWMGPAIGPRAFEVGPEVREAFLAGDPGADAAFAAHRPGKYLADIYALARRRLERAGVTRVHGGGFCTVTESARFFSYRREKSGGRMGAFIWIEPD